MKGEVDVGLVRPDAGTWQRLHSRVVHVVYHRAIELLRNRARDQRREQPVQHLCFVERDRVERKPIDQRERHALDERTPHTRSERAASIKLKEVRREQQQRQRIAAQIFDDREQFARAVRVERKFPVLLGKRVPHP